MHRWPCRRSERSSCAHDDSGKHALPFFMDTFADTRQELYFLHERSKYLMTQQAIQVILTTIYVIFASPIAGKITPEWWYGLGAALAGAIFIAALLFLPETKYERPLSSFQEASEGSSDIERTTSKDAPDVVMCTIRPELDLINYQPRTFRSDLRLWAGTPDLKAVVDVWKVCSVTSNTLLFSLAHNPLSANVPTAPLSQRFLGPLS